MRRSLLVDPGENQLKQELEKAFQARVEPVRNIEFIPDTLLKPNVKVLSKLTPTNSAASPFLCSNIKYASQQIWQG